MFKSSSKKTHSTTISLVKKVFSAFTLNSSTFSGHQFKVEKSVVSQLFPETGGKYEVWAYVRVDTAKKEKVIITFIK